MEKQKAIVYLVTKLELGGAQKVCLALFEQLQKEKYTTFLISGSEGALVERIKDNKQVILLNCFKREVSLKNLVLEVKNFFALIQHIKNIKKQYPNLIVHTHSTKAGILGRWAALCAGVKLRMHTVHGFGFHPYQNPIAWLIHYSLELLTSIITTTYVCVSSADIKTGIRLLPGFAKKSVLIRAAVDNQFFLPASRIKKEISTKKFIFGTVSCFKKQKNLFDLLNAFAQVKKSNPDIKLEIIGDGHLRPDIEQWIKNNQLEEDVQLHGWQQNVAAFMSSWHTFVLSSLWEGLPCSVVEARLLHLPVISYDTGGINDVIISGSNGFLINPKAWQELAQAMFTLSINSELYKRLNNYNENLIEFTHNNMIQKHISLYS